VSKIPIAIILCILACPVKAMESGEALESEQGSQTDAITVTATRIGQSGLQETGISATIITAEDLENTGAENVNGIGMLAPNVSISENANAAQIYIRGVGSNLVFVGSDPSSAIYIDGVYQGRPTTYLMDFIDLSHAEVLRGPQGTLYGRNTVGGAIHLLSNEPEAHSSVKTSLEMGSYQKRKFKFVANEPVSEDLFGRVALFQSRRDGYVDNAFNGDDLVDKNAAGLRASLKYLINDDVDFVFGGDYLKVNETGAQYKPTLLKIDPNSAQESLELVDGVADISDFYTVNIPFSPYHDQKNFGFMGKLNVNLDKYSTLTSLTSHRESQTNLGLDTDFTEVDSILTFIEENQRQFSQELHYSIKRNLWQWGMGLFYFEENADFNFDVHKIKSEPPLSGHDVSAKTKAYAWFTHGQWHLTNTVRVNYGLRYNVETKEFVNYKNVVGESTKDWDVWTPKLGVDYVVSPQAMLYGNVSRGFKSGGFNSYDSSAFAPEDVWAYEAGIKFERWSQRVQVNIGVFYYDYDDLQVSAFEESDNPHLIISNAAKANIKGAELELRMMPTENWEVLSAISLLDARYDQFITARAGGQTSIPIDVSDNKLNASPDKTLNLSLQYTQPAEAGSFMYLLSYYWQDQVYYTAFNDTITGQDAYGLWNAQVDWLTYDEQWQLSLFGHNLANKEYTNATQDFSPLGVTRTIMPPRTFGIKLTYQQ